jgi:peptidoglycan/xylan/chitin deacetylase (PgdA/CDA1 family)
MHTAALVSGELPSGRKCVAITFDDAFTSVAENALPELARHSLHSTIFVPVGWIGRTPGWVMEDNEPALAAVVNPELTEVVISSEQLNALSASLVSLESHSVTHPSMLKLDTKQARREIEDSRHRLAELSGREILGFSFPTGNMMRPRSRCAVQPVMKLHIRLRPRRSIQQVPIFCEGGPRSIHPMVRLNSS